MKRKIRLPETLFRKGFDTEPKEEEPINKKAVKKIIPFVKANFTSAKTFNNRQSSYRLKKVLERCASYKIEIHNGDFIAAMIICGYPYKISSTNSLNCYFKMLQVKEKEIQSIINNK